MKILYNKYQRKTGKIYINFEYFMTILHSYVNLGIHGVNGSA